MMPRKDRPATPHYRPLTLPCPHCFSLACLCIVERDAVAQARAAVEARHHSAVRRAEHTLRTAEWADAS